MAVLFLCQTISAMFTCQLSALLISILSTAALLKLCHNKTLLMQDDAHIQLKRFPLEQASFWFLSELLCFSLKTFFLFN